MAPRILRREKMLEKIFKLKENNTTARTEIIAGLTTFMTMAYIIALNPNLLTGFGKDTMPELWNGVFLATCIASAIGTIVMAFLANKPFAMAPGMGLNAYFAYTVVLSSRSNQYRSPDRHDLCGILPGCPVYCSGGRYCIPDPLRAEYP